MALYVIHWRHGLFCRTWRLLANLVCPPLQRQGISDRIAVRIGQGVVQGVEENAKFIPRL
ncbi:MAG: hypothetical protein R3293_12445 [Candidatus Promineifilaceae bacterium]|nr:hypothetical protein [Candidatus Promineifilaceae bacterium]